MSAWERELVEVLASPDPTGRLADAIPHLVVSGRCDCCRSFDLRDTRRSDDVGSPTRFSEATSPDLRWRFILWLDDDGEPFAVEQATEATGTLPPPQALRVSRVSFTPGRLADGAGSTWR